MFRPILIHVCAESSPFRRLLSPWKHPSISGGFEPRTLSLEARYLKSVRPTKVLCGENWQYQLSRLADGSS